jgi:hypothetical protein
MAQLIRRQCSAFLLNAVSVNPNAELLASLRDQICLPGAWDEFVLHANRNRVAGLVLHNLNQIACQELIPESAREAMRARAAIFVDKYEIALQDLAAIHASFTHANLPYLLFKGAALVATVYPNAGLRPFADYDLLVERSRIDHADSLLEQLGYGSTDPLPRKYYLRFHLHLTYSRKTPRANIDLHWSFVGPYDLVTVDYHTLIHRARVLSDSPLPCPILSPADQVLVNAIHLHKHLSYLLPVLGHPDLSRYVADSKYLILACDFVRLLRHYTASHPIDELTEQMKMWNVSDKLQFCALLCRALWEEEEHLTPLLHELRVKRRASGRLLAGFLASWTGLSHKPSRLSGVTPTRLLTLPVVFFPGSELLERYYRAKTPGAVFFRRIVHPLRLGLLMCMNLACCLAGWARIAAKTGWSKLHRPR